MASKGLRRSPLVVTLCLPLLACSGSEDLGPSYSGATFTGMSETDSGAGDEASDTGAPGDTGSSSTSNPGDSGDGDGDGDDSGASATATSGDDSSSTDGGDGDGGPLLDVGSDTGDSSSGGMSSGGGSGETGADSGCQGIDFLFVIDNSLSMEDEQAQLIASVPGFFDTIEQTIEDAAQDFHVMVATTDGGGGAYCSEWCAQQGNPNGTWCSGISCADWPAAPTGCDATLGAGEIDSGAGASCGLPTGQRFFNSTQVDASSTFSCVANQGVTGSGAERPVEAALEAISPAMNQGGACNQGFLRDDAILVVTLITDEEDDAATDPAGGSPGDPPQWVDDLIAAKGGDPDAVVLIGLIGDTDLPGAQCAPLDPGGTTGAEGAPRLRQFVEGLGTQGLWDSVCLPDYGPLFDQAVGLIDTTCDGFIPPE